LSLALLITNNFIIDSSSIEDERSMGWKFYRKNEEFINLIDGIIESIKIVVKYV
jgi:hypothetical protein